MHLPTLVRGLTFLYVDIKCLHEAYTDSAMLNKENFTAERVAGYICEPRKDQSLFWDAKTPGLGLRVTRRGSKSYIFETRLHGNTLRMTIGDLRTWTVGKAQAEATRLKSMTDQGIDPREVVADKAKAQEAARTESKRKKLPAKDAWNDYIQARRKVWSARHLADHEAIAKNELAPMLALKLGEIDSEAVKNWLIDEISRRPTRAALGYRHLRAFLNWCEDSREFKGIASPTACNPRLAKDLVPKPAKKSDCLQREQLKAWFTEVRAIRNPVIAAYIQTLLLIGSRREELADLEWDAIDFRWKSMTIGDKVEGERTIPLTPYVESLLRKLPRLNNWVFSSPLSASGRLQEPSIQHRRACGVAGIQGLSLHGLRRSFTSLTDWIECPAGVVHQIQGHKPSATVEKHYKVRPLDMLRMWHTKIESWILEQGGVHHD